MKYIVESDKEIDQAATDLEAAVKNNGFGVLHVYDLQAILKSKGIEFQHECRVFEVCNPQKANEILTHDISLNMALPCRISIWEEGGKTRLGMVSPKASLEMLSDSSDLAALAGDVEQSMRAMIEEAK